MAPRRDFVASLGASALAFFRGRRPASADGYEISRSSELAPGRPLDWIDLRDYGVSRDGQHDATSAVQRAFSEALASANGGVIYAPLGTYMITHTLAVPPVTNKTLRLVGQGRRATVFTAARKSMGRLLHWGSAERDIAGSGAEAHSTMYGGIENITLNAAEGARDVTLLQMVQPQFVTVREVNLEGARLGYGLKLLGSVNRGGLSSPAPPHAWRCKFYDVWADDCMHPAYLENADENDFFACNFSVSKGAHLFGEASAGSEASDSLFAIEIVEGRNNRWFGGLLMGDTDPRYRSAYVGAMLRGPVHGEVRNNQWHGTVIEGFHRTAIIGDQNVLGTTFLLEHRSMSDGDVVNTALPSPQNKTMVHSPIGDTWYYAGRLPYNDPLQYGLTSGNSTVSVLTGNVVVLSGNEAGSVVTDFTNGMNGQEITVHFADDRVTLQVGPTMKLRGGVNFAGAANNVLTLSRRDGVWYEKSRSVN